MRRPPRRRAAHDDQARRPGAAAIIEAEVIIANPEDALGLLAATWPDHRDQAHGGGSGTAADPASRSPPHPRAEPGRQRVHAHPAVHEPHPTAENVSTIQFGVMEHQEHRAPQQGRRRRSGTRTMKSPQLMAKSTGAYLKKSDYFWRRLASHFRRPEFVRCLYDHLNSIDVSAVDWKAERKANLTSSYYGLAALYSPLEALFFEELVQNIRRGKLPMHMTPYPEHKPVAWWRPATFRKYFLYMWMQDWASQHGHNQRMKPSSKKFYNTVLEGLDLPVKPVKRDGYPTTASSGISGSGTRFSTWHPWTFTAPLEASVVCVVQKGSYRQYNKD